jgi:hypothetical protein
MAMALVYRSEGIQVADDHGQRAAGARGALELRLEHLLEGAAVEEPGERVRAGAVRDAGAQRPDAPLLVQGKACQRERACNREQRSEGAYRLHFPMFIDPRALSLEVPTGGR